MGSRSQGAGAGLFWSEPEPKKFGRLRLRTRCRYSDDFFGNFNFKFSKNFKISKFFPKLIDFKLTFKKIQKLVEITSQITFLTLCIVRKSFPFRSRNGAGAETSEPEPPNFGPAPHPWPKLHATITIISLINRANYLYVHVVVFCRFVAIFIYTLRQRLWLVVTEKKIRQSVSKI